MISCYDIDFDFIFWANCFNFDLLSWPAWIQAVGSVAVIVVAFWIGHSDRRRDAVERRLKARSLAFAVYPALKGMEEKITNLLAHFDQVENNDLYQHIGPETMTIEIPSVLSERSPEFFLLEDTGNTVLQYVAKMKQYNEKVAKIRDPAGHIMPGIEIRHSKSLPEALKILESAINSTRQIRDGN